MADEYFRSAAARDAYRRPFVRTLSPSDGARAGREDLVVGNVGPGATFRFTLALRRNGEPS